MSSNKKLVNRLFSEAMNERKFEILNELIHSEYINHTFPGDASGPEGLKNILGMFDAAFPDMKITVEDIIEDGNKLATYGYWRGTHKGNFQGVSGTGKNVKVDYIDIWKIKDGKLHENWVQMDIAGLLHQLGAIK
jgi:steroid delta-isomerase-like uncharacterized protein